MAVGELFLAAFIRLLLDQLVAPQLLNFARREGLRKKMYKWRITLSRVQAVLDDAEEKQHTDRVVKQWLDDLRDLAYDVEDILDEFAIEDFRRKLEGGNQDSTGKVQKLIPTCLTSLSPSALKINIRFGSKIKEINARFNDIMTQKDQLNLKEIGGGRSNRRRGTLPSTSLVNEACIYGREKDKEAILELLLGEKCSDVEVSVIPILGMGGIGKTTLAQLVYNDEKVQSSFDLKAWACVSEDFDAVRVTKTVLKSVTFESSDDNDLNLLQVQLKEKLKGKKFLVILDDVWNEDYHDWTILRAPFEAGAPGSSIVITTRNQGVSSMMRTINVQAYHLQVLSNDSCLSILTHHALETTDFSAHLNLKDIGEEIAVRCKGLPLAAKVLGGLLRTKQLDCDEWEEVVRSKIWDIPEERSGIVPALMLSYHHLPSYLKRCFAYCSIFPKDYEFEEQHLVLLWVAEGLIPLQEEEKQAEDLGKEYFGNLLSRSFFQLSSKDKPRFVMHDIIHDLAQWVARDIYFRMEDKFQGRNEGKFSKKARHSSFLGGYYDRTEKFEAFHELTCLRTFLPLMLPSPGYCYLTCNVPFQLLPKLRCLRVLSLGGYHITKLPDSISNLKHLRYLDLSYTRIRRMPESTTTLHNLQTLILESCSFLKKLPSTFENLVNLRHLNILKVDRLEGMPPAMHKLTCLQTLSNLIVGKDKCSGIKELGPLSHLRGTLHISRLENVTEPRDARDANLIGKPNLRGLLLKWSRNINDLRDKTIELEVLDMLRPHKALKELIIRRYAGAKFPTWLKGPSLANIVFLRIKDCKKCTSLPPLGPLPSLKVLSIQGMDSVQNVGLEFYGESCSEPFRSLDTLSFKNMLEWENWIPCKEFPNLRELFIRSSPKLLGKLPSHLPLLKKVVINGCERLVVSVSSFPELCKVEIEESKGVVCRGKVDFNSLNFKSLSTISEFRCQTEGFFMEGLTHVQDLTLDSCEELTTLWSNNVGLLQTLPCLHVLKIFACPKLVSLVANKVEEQLQQGLPSTLREIQIRDCNIQEFLPKAMIYNNTCLETIYIDHCNSLTYFAIGQLPPTLKRLKIERCKNMLILLDEDDSNSCSSRSTSLLEDLAINYCPFLKYLTSSGELPATLKLLKISCCGKLESIAKSFHHNSSLEKIDIVECGNLRYLPMGIHNLNHLDEIYIWDCPTLVCFPDGGLFPANLRALTIFCCEKISALPICIHNFTSLQRLRIGKCPSILSFPQEGFPTNLTSLNVWDLNIIDALFEWGLHRLTSLQQLDIKGGCPQLVSFPEMMLPVSLTSLTIQCFSNLKYLSPKVFPVLNSLLYLSIYECEKLTSFPKDGLPPSLIQLRICTCKKLASLPEDGLPPSVLQLYIEDCPLLKEHCKRDQGREWSKIAHIPCIYIDDRFIYDPENEN